MFHNRRKDQLQVLYADGQGRWLWDKRLEPGRFCIPPAACAASALDARGFSLLLEGLDVALAEQAPRRAMRTVAYEKDLPLRAIGVQLPAWNAW